MIKTVSSSNHNKRTEMADYDTPGLLYDSGVLYDVISAPASERKRMAKVKLNLASLTDEQLLQKANDIKTAMTGNASYTTPIPTLTVLGTSITASQTKLNEWFAAQNTAQQKTTEKNALLDTLRAQLTQLAAYVEAASGGDAAKIQSAGMDVKAANAPLGLPGQVLNVSLTAGDAEGQLDAAWDRDRAAKTYEIQISVDPITGTSWQNRPSVTRSSATLTGLTSGQKIWVRVRAVGAAGHGAWSDPATKIVP